MATTRLKLATLLFLTATAGFAAEPAPRDAHGDPLPAHAVARLGTVRWRHGGAVTFVAHTPDGKALLTDSEDGTLRLWDLASGAELRRFEKTERSEGNNLNGFLVLFRSVAYGTALSPNGRMVAAGSKDGTITVWDLATAKVIRTLKPAETAGTSGLAFSPDNELLASKDQNQVVHLWDLAQGKQLRQFGKQMGQVRGFSIGEFTGPPVFQAGGSVLTCIRGDFGNNQFGVRLHRWDVVTGRELPSVKVSEGGNEFLAFGFSPDGKTLATAGFQGVARLVDRTTGKELHKLTGLNMFSFITQYAFSPDGKTLAGWCADQTIHVWEVATGKELRVLGEPTGPKFMGASFLGGLKASNLEFSRDGKFLVLGTSGCSIHRWEMETGKEVASQPGHRAALLTLAVSPDGKTVVSRGADRVAHAWDTATGKEMNRFALPSEVTHAVFSPDGQVLALGCGDGSLRVWDVKSAKEVRKWQAATTGFNALAYSADGKKLASRGFDQVIRVWDPATGKEERQIGEKPNGNANRGNDFLRNFLTTEVPGVRFSADSATLATMPPVDDPRLANFGIGGMGAKNRSALHLWDVGTGRLIRKFTDQPGSFTTFAYAPDGRTLATAGTDGSLVLWEAITGKVRVQFQTAGFTAIIQGLVDRFGDQVMQRQAAGLGGKFTALAFSPNGRILAGAGKDRTIRFWDAVSGQKIGMLTGHQGKIVTLQWMPDSKRLISGSSDTTALVWDVTPLLKSHQTQYPSLEDGRAEGLWQALEGDDPARVYGASLRLIGAPRQVVPVLRERVRPVPAPDAARLARLLTELDHKQFSVRQKAADELEKLGELAAHPVKEALAAKPSLERQQRLERVRDRLVATTTLTPAQRQVLRAVEVLERIGTPEAREVLRTLAGGAAGARLTRESQASLDRLGKS